MSSAYLDEKAMGALEFFKQWRTFTKDALRVVAPNCPSMPMHKSPMNGKMSSKTRPWKNPAGPTGLLLHATGGPNGIASMRWSNENPDNHGSSWHCTVLDSRLPELDPILQRYPLVRDRLPVTAFLHADIDKGTWHGNWTNSRLFGLENRNLGPLQQREGKFGYALRRNKGGMVFMPLRDQKRAMLPSSMAGGRYWESYTLEQLVANINIGRALRDWRGCDFDPSWVLPHSAVWWSKIDVGPLYPIHFVRQSIFSDIPIDRLYWLKMYPVAAGEMSRECSNDLYMLHNERCSGSLLFGKEYSPTTPEQFDAAAGSDWRKQLPAISSMMGMLGYLQEETYFYMDPTKQEQTYPLSTALRWATFIFQMSTRCPSCPGEHVLKVDGIPGPKTQAALRARLEHVKYSY